MEAPVFLFPLDSLQRSAAVSLWVIRFEMRISEVLNPIWQSGNKEVALSVIPFNEWTVSLKVSDDSELCSFCMCVWIYQGHLKLFSLLYILQDTGFSLTHLEPIFSVQDMVARGAQHCNSLLLPLCAAWLTCSAVELAWWNLEHQEYWLPCSPENIFIHGFHLVLRWKGLIASSSWGNEKVKDGKP